MQKRRALSLFLVLVMVFSLLPGTVQASGETAAIAIQEKTITTSTTTVTVKVTGYEGLSNATLRLSVGPDGTESDWGISNPPRTALGSLKYTGPDTYTFAIDPAKLAAGKNVQAYLYYWSDSRVIPCHFENPVTLRLGNLTEINIHIVFHSTVFMKNNDTQCIHIFDRIIYCIIHPIGCTRLIKKTGTQNEYGSIVVRLYLVRITYLPSPTRCRQ